MTFGDFLEGYLVVAPSVRENRIARDLIDIKFVLKF